VIGSSGWVPSFIGVVRLSMLLDHMLSIISAGMDNGGLTLSRNVMTIIVRVAWTSVIRVIKSFRCITLPQRQMRSNGRSAGNLSSKNNLFENET